MSPAHADAPWITLFDGSSLDAWREYNKQAIESGWEVKEGELVVIPASKEPPKTPRQNLITKEKFAAFELELEFRVTPGANSGVMYHVVETPKPPYVTGPEIQIQDNTGKDPQKCGWLYQLYAAETDATKPVGEWNQLRIVVTPEECYHEMNGVRYVTYVKGSDDWDAKVAASKFSKWDGFGEATTGHICLQDHADEVGYRNIRVRRLD
ncbi:MAG: DUF1080 domain-containing protein [Planctomycetota bacterium]